MQAVQPQPETKKPNLLEGLFGSSPKLESSPASSVSSTATLNEPLTPEAERLLAQVPDTISDNSEAALPEAEEPQPEGDAIAALMAQVAFEPQDVQDVLCEFFDYLAERFQSEHWQLTDRQARMLGRPAAQLANAMWVKMQNYLPDVLGRWCEETPGATAFILAAGLVIGPKVSMQIKISRERKRNRPAIRPTQSESGPVAVEKPKDKPAQSGVIWSEGGVK